MTQEKTIYIDPNQNFDLWDISQLTTKLEVTRGAEETRHCPETSEGNHLGGNPLKLMKQCLTLLVIKELSTHLYRSELNTYRLRM